ncbi:hypothetical protein [Aquimarina sp. 2304DJ70-9]|uniref:hypothetical protein n=1 Tax=Aquimarina penaris TaxID=3231044 RepID=UPI0034631403
MKQLAVLFLVLSSIMSGITFYKNRDLNKELGLLKSQNEEILEKLQSELEETQLELEEVSYEKDGYQRLYNVAINSLEELEARCKNKNAEMFSF